MELRDQFYLFQILKNIFVYFYFISIKPSIRNVFSPLNTFLTPMHCSEARKLFKFLIHKRKLNAETIWNFQGFTIPKKNSCRGNYMRKYGKLPVKSFNLKKTRFHKKKPGDYKGIQITTTFLPILLFRTKYYSKYANIKSTLQDLTYHFDVMPIAYFLWQVEHLILPTVVVTLRTKAICLLYMWAVDPYRMSSSDMIAFH